MRTTLKRGLAGDGTRVDGNGGGPFSPLTPVTRYRARRRGPLRLVGKILFWLLVVLLVAAGGLGGGVWLFLNESVSAVRAHSPEVREAQRILDVPAPNEPTVAMVIGYDKRQGVDRGQEPRSDTVMLVRADPRRRAITMLSFPRDLVVDIPGCRGHPPFSGRINEAYTYCGPKGTLQTVKSLTKIPVNYMVTVNFRGFVNIVDRLGGVYLDIDRRYLNDNSGLAPGQTFATIDVHAGYQRLRGRDALDYVRYRHTDSDIYRIARQQSFVKAMKQQVSGFWSLSKLPGIVNTITENVEVGVGGGETLDVETLYGYAKLAYGLPSGNFHQVELEGLTGYNELSAPPEAIAAAVDEFSNPDVGAAERAAAAATGKQPARPTGPPAASVTVEVLNGNGVAGAADEAAYLLSRRGYPVTNGGNADAFDYFETQILYDPAQADSEAAAKALAARFGEAQVAAADTPLATMVRVIVGQTFHGALAPSPRDKIPRHEPPQVVRDASLVPVVRRAQRRLDFRLFAPTVREETSTLDDDEPTRAYRLAGHGAFRMVFRTGGGEYWGIQQTSWTDAPILEGPSVVRTIKGREYRLFFDGPRLHMIAFEENGAVYWVTNTLLDRLSNETMLAVAQGLRPL